MAKTPVFLLFVYSITTAAAYPADNMHVMPTSQVHNIRTIHVHGGVDIKLSCTSDPDETVDWLVCPECGDEGSFRLTDPGILFVPGTHETVMIMKGIHQNMLHLRTTNLDMVITFMCEVRGQDVIQGIFHVSPQLSRLPGNFLARGGSLTQKLPLSEDVLLHISCRGACRIPGVCPYRWTKDDAPFSDVTELFVFESGTYVCQNIKDNKIILKFAVLPTKNADAPKVRQGPFYAYVMPSTLESSNELPSITELSTDLSSTTELPMEMSSSAELPTELLSKTEIHIELPATTELPIQLSSMTELPVELASITELSVELASITELPVELASMTELPVELASTTELPIDLSSATELHIKLAPTTEFPRKLPSLTGRIEQTQIVKEAPGESFADSGYLTDSTSKYFTSTQTRSTPSTPLSGSSVSDHASMISRPKPAKPDGSQGGTTTFGPNETLIALCSVISVLLTVTVVLCLVFSVMLRRGRHCTGSAITEKDSTTTEMTGMIGENVGANTAYYATPADVGVNTTYHPTPADVGVNTTYHATPADVGVNTTYHATPVDVNTGYRPVPCDTGINKCHTSTSGTCTPNHHYTQLPLSGNLSGSTVSSRTTRSDNIT